MQRGSLVLALAVQDQRPYVLSGVKHSTFVGLRRGGWGNGRDVTTESGQTLSADFASSIRRGLMSAGYSVKTVEIGDRASPAEVRRELLRTGAQRGLAVQIEEWKSDIYSGTALAYGVAVAVVDGGGREIGRTAINGRDVIVSGGHATADQAETAVPVAYARKLEELLNAPAIRQALAPPDGPT